MKAMEFLKALYRDTHGQESEIMEAIVELQLLEQRNAELEQRVKELEAPKTCEGCKHNRFGNDSYGVAIDCTSRNGNCARQWYKDYYELKDTK